MSDEANGAPGVAVDNTAAPAAPAFDQPALTLREASAMLASRRENPEQAPDKVEPPANELPSKEESAARESDPGEQQKDEASDPAEKPSVEPPRSWSKEDKEAFAALPPEVQARIADREAKREAEFRRGQNEVAEQRKAAEAERHKVEQARLQYENALPALLATLEQQNAGEFNDIKSWDDVQRMAEEDPFRFTKWQAHQARINDTKQKLSQVQQRRAVEASQAFESYAEEQDRLFLERAPEFSDGRSAEKARRDAVEYLTKEIGFDEAELAAAWSGQKGISLRDAKVQTLVRDAMKWRAAEKARASAKPTTPVPPVQKPGVTTSRAEARAGDLRALDQRLSETGSLRDAAALLAARRAAQR